MKPTTTQALKDLKNYLNACDGLNDDEKARFNEIIEEVFYAESPVIKGGKFDIYKFVGNEPYRPVLTGVYYDNGNVVATDGYILAVIKQDYEATREGQIITSDGHVLEAYKYVNYKGVIPTTDGWSAYNIDFAKVRDIIKRSKAWAKANGYKQNCTNRLIKIGPAYFSLKYFELLVSGMDYIGVNKLVIKDGTTCTVCQNDKGTLLLMPHCEPQETEGVFVAELTA